MFPGVGGGVEMMGNRRERIVRAKGLGGGVVNETTLKSMVLIVAQL